MMTPVKPAESISEQTVVKSAFELPVDSFETHLKKIIHEELPEKE